MYLIRWCICIINSSSLSTSCSLMKRFILVKLQWACLLPTAMLLPYQGPLLTTSSGYPKGGIHVSLEWESQEGENEIATVKTKPLCRTESRGYLGDPEFYKNWMWISENQEQLKQLNCATPYLYIGIKPHNFIQLRFCTGSNLAHSMSKICNGEDLWQWSQLEIRLNVFHWSTISKKKFIITITIKSILAVL